MKRHSAKPTPQAAAGAPVRLPLVQMSVRPDGAMTVLLDGQVYEPPPYAPAWRREAFSAVLEAITTSLGTAVKVTVTEYDGATFTDVVMPPRAPAPLPVAPVSAPVPIGQVPPVPVQGHGFLAGEDVAIAPIIGYGSAAPDGQVNAVVAQDQIPANVQEMLLVGRVSGTMQLVRATP
ncbi:hypothetical protein ICL81_01250 [Leucobacter sp. cx-328]|uniref:hypothetical protein n=1 Tax=unclassified Leucobacter TaxID=2621730 RepID=UPI00165DD874|nr:MULTISPECIES: hypothetical protein [unclassified Leucobacter]MBC9943155.1 hypothetical protein [Leucobacter sp. cx-328]